MDRLEFDAYIQTFPALEVALLARYANPQKKWQDLRSPEHCEGFALKALDKTFLSYTPTHNSHVGRMVSINKMETINFVMADGTVTRNAVNQRGTHYTHENPYHSKGETVLEAIDRHGAERLSYAIMVRTGFTTQDHHSTSDYSVTIFRPTYAATVAAAVDQAKHEALAKTLTSTQHGAHP